MISISINGLTISGENESELHLAIALVGRVAEAAKANGATVATQGARPMAVAAQGIDYCAQWVSSPLNTQGKSQFRLRQDEVNAGLDRQEAARIRLADAGLIDGKGSGEEAVTFEGEIGMEGISEMDDD